VDIFTNLPGKTTSGKTSTGSPVSALETGELVVPKSDEDGREHDFLKSLWDGRLGNTACQKQIFWDNLTVSAQEMLIEEIRHQPELVVREVLHYLKFLERQRAQENWSDVLPSREVEQEKLDILDGK
jgi:hypothetical protein